MSDNKDEFYEDDQLGQVYVPKGESVDEVAADIRHEDTLAMDVAADAALPEPDDAIEVDVLAMALEDREDFGKTRLMDRSSAYPDGVDFGKPSAEEVGSRVHELALLNANGPAEGYFTRPAPASDLHDEVTLQDEIASVLNKYSAENESGTPDFILAEYLMASLQAYNKTVKRRAQWHGTSDLEELRTVATASTEPLATNVRYSEGVAADAEWGQARDELAQVIVEELTGVSGSEASSEDLELAEKVLELINERFNKHNNKENN